MKNETLKKCWNIIISQRCPVCHLSNPERTQYKSAGMLQTGAGVDMQVLLGFPLRVLSDDRVLLKKIMALVPMRHNNSKARGTKWCDVESSTYSASFLVAASSAAAVAIIDVDI